VTASLRVTALRSETLGLSSEQSGTVVLMPLLGRAKHDSASNSDPARPRARAPRTILCAIQAGACDDGRCA
jgi:hypothetical protein